MERRQFQHLFSMKFAQFNGNLSDDDFDKLIDACEKSQLVQKTIRNFSNIKTLHFISLKLDIISLECLQWVLKSLRRDEMMPSEKAILSRIKEAFAFKV